MDGGSVRGNTFFIVMRKGKTLLLEKIARLQPLYLLVNVGYKQAHNLELKKAK